MKTMYGEVGLTATHKMSEEDASKWWGDFIAFGQAFSKEVGDAVVYVPYEDVYKMDEDI